MVENNPCVASGCPGLCCQNTSLEYVTPSERTRCFKNATHLATFGEVKSMVDKHIEGTYYTEDPERKLMFYAVTFVGKCQNLDVTGNCLIHTEREEAAKRTLFGGKYCNETRKLHNLPPVEPLNNDNLCTQAGCKGACCHNILTSWSTTESRFKLVFPEAIRISRSQLFSDNRYLKGLKNSVRYLTTIKEDGYPFIVFYIAGKCPQLSSDNNCNLYGKKLYPGGCQETVIGGDLCNKCRSRDFQANGNLKFI